MILGWHRRAHPLELRSERERQVLQLMAEGRSNAGIVEQLHISERTVESHISSILTKLGIDVSADNHRRVLAVLAYLDTGAGVPPS
ncbi:MAG: LuxR C-terminal-related transcriptional regulator [Nitriliruptorales bacterium]|nr:LuxR C-terminal-related transcriptional regulator [Nitriliruptorales bacterium]